MIESPFLQRLEGYVNGEWTPSVSGQVMEVTNPATGELLAEVPRMGSDDARRAIETGRAALAVETTPEQRVQWLEAIRDGLLENKEEFGRIITLEQGKPLKESIGEVEYGAGFYGFFASQVARLAPRKLDTNSRGCTWTVRCQPAGVTGLIGTWNFPLAVISKKLAPAIAAGCSVVAKPSSPTPLTMVAFWRLLERLGFPPGKMNLVIGRASEIGKVFCEHPAVRVISCTGSTETGKALMRQSVNGVKRLSLELGGNAPFIVFDDADLDAAADALMANKFRCGGQTCVCANRVYVHGRVREAFLGAVSERMARLKVGNGLEPDTDVGPLIDRAGFDKVAAHVADALAKGAKRILGDDPERPEHDWGCFYPPTLLQGADEDMRVFKEETFGPVVAAAAFNSDEEAVTRANSTQYGLAAYVFTADGERALSVCRKLRFGHVGINTGTGPTPEAPFGGMKQSGFGREGGEEGLMEFVELQVAAEGPGRG